MPAGRRFFLYCLILIPLLASDLRVIDHSGAPVAGAFAVAESSGMSAFSGADGSLAIVCHASDTLSVSAPGYRAWKGVPGEGDTICIDRDPVPSGVVITVTAEAPGTAAEGPSSTRLEGGDIEALSSIGPSALEARVPSLSVREYGGAHPIISISVRGSDASQLGWLVGRHSLQSGTDGLPAAFPDPALFASMTVSRGGSSAMVGGAPSGAVVLEPAGPSSPALVRAGIDSGGGRSLTARFSPGGLLGISASVRRTTGSNEAMGTSGSLLAAAGGPTGGVGLLVSSGAGEIEGPDWSLPAIGRRGHGSIDLWGNAGAGGFELAAGFRSSVMTYSAVSPAPADDRHSSGLTDASVTRMLGFGPAVCTLGADVAWDRVSSTAAGTHGRLRQGLSAAALLETGVIPVSTALRVEWQAGGRTVAGARLGTSLILLGDSALTASLSAARGFRRPTFNDLYWPADAFAEGNPGLEPETCEELEAVVAARPCAWLALEMAGWLARDHDQISWQPSGDGIWRPGNTSSVDRMGLETSAVLQAGPLDIAGSVSLMEVEDASPGSVNEGCRLPYRPGIAAGLSAGLDAGALDLGAAAGWTGRRYTNAANTAWLEPRLLLDLSADWSPGWARGWGAGTWASNLLDADYEESYGYPGKSRTIGIEIHWKEEA